MVGAERSISAGSVTGSAAREALAEVDRRPAVHLRAPAEQRDPVGRPEGEHVGRRRGLDRRTGDRRVGRADDRHLAMRREVLVERDEQPAERRRRARQRVAHEAQHRDAAPLQLVVAPDAREPQQHVGEHRVAARRRMVVELLLARDELLAVARRLEEAARVVVGEQVDRERREPVRLEQPARRRRSRRAAPSARRRRRRSPRGSPCPSRRRPATCGAAARPASRARPSRKLRQRGRRRDAAALGERGEQQAVPRGDRLVVAERLRPLLAQGVAAVRASPRRARRAARSGRARTARAAPRARLRRAPR